MPFLRNAWYVAAWANELSSNTLFTRTILGKPVLLYRDSSDAPVALSNLCPHRFAPLHKGRLDNGLVECPYHGLVFGTDGRCVRNPHGDGRIPAAMKVHCYPICERFGAIWIWPGDPAYADEARLVDFSFLDPAHHRARHRYIYSKSNYQLGIDNALDLSHLQYVHAATLGSDKIVLGEAEFAQTGHTVWSTRMTKSEKLTSFLSKTRGVSGNILVDRRVEIRWDPPSLIAINIKATESGMPDNVCYLSRAGHFLTPETESSTHYFFAPSLPIEIDKEDEQRLEDLADHLLFPLQMEDIPMIEAQQQAIGDTHFASMQPTPLSIDTATIRARRIMDKLIADEAKQMQQA